MVVLFSHLVGRKEVAGPHSSTSLRGVFVGDLSMWVLTEGEFSDSEIAVIFSDLSSVNLFRNQVPACDTSKSFHYTLAADEGAAVSLLVDHAERVDNLRSDYCNVRRFLPDASSTRLLAINHKLIYGLIHPDRGRL